MTKELSLLIFCVIFSMFFVISCSSDEEEDLVDTETGNSSENGDQNGNDNGDNADENGSENNQNSENTDNSGQNDNNINENDDIDENTVDNDLNGTGDNENNGTNDNENGDDSDNGDSQQPDTDVDTGDTGSNPGDDGNLNTGDTSGNQAQSGSVGAPCSSENDCKGSYGSGDSEQGMDCVKASDGFPGGYCTFNIDGTDSAACSSTGELAYNFGGSWGGNGLCLHRCTKPSDCRENYRCSNKIHACLPDCNKNGYECFLGVCDETDGVCLKGGY